MNIFWDLDGTIVDSTHRLYGLFCELTHCKVLSYEEYWSYKYMGYKQSEMLELVGCNNVDPCMFSKKWLEYVEKKDWLSIDRLQPYSDVVIKELASRGVNQYILTNRQSTENAKWELDNLGIGGYFKSVLSTRLKCEKWEIICGQGLSEPGDIIVGDSVEDVYTGRKSGLGVVIVCNDVRLEPKLKVQNPDYIIYDRRKILGMI